MTTKKQDNTTTDLLLALQQLLAEVKAKLSPAPFAEYLCTKQAAKYLGLSRQRLEIWRINGGGPKFTKLAQAVRYRRVDLDEFMAARARLNTTKEG